MPRSNASNRSFKLNSATEARVEALERVRAEVRRGSRTFSNFQPEKQISVRTKLHVILPSNGKNTWLLTQANDLLPITSSCFKVR